MPYEKGNGSANVCIERLIRSSEAEPLRAAPPPEPLPALGPQSRQCRYRGGVAGIPLRGQPSQDSRASPRRAPLREGTRSNMTLSPFYFVVFNVLK